MTITRATLLAAAVLAGAPATAQTQYDMNMQTARDFRAADAAMAVQWRSTYAAMKRMDASDPGHGGRGQRGYAAAALASQRAWLAFRDAECEAEGMRFAGGSGQSAEETMCRTALTRQRTVQLRRMAQRDG